MTEQFVYCVNRKKKHWNSIICLEQSTIAFVISGNDRDQRCDAIIMQQFNERFTFENAGEKFKRLSLFMPTRRSNNGRSKKGACKWIRKRVRISDKHLWMHWNQKARRRKGSVCLFLDLYVFIISTFGTTEIFLSSWCWISN